MKDEIRKIISKDTLRENRIPPGQHEVDRIPILDLGKLYYPIDKNKYTLEITGLVENKITLNYEDLLKLPAVELFCDLHCVTTWSKLSTTWKGIETKTIYELAKVKKEAKYVMAYSYDGYSTNIPLEYFLKEDSIIAYQYEGNDIPHAYGGPVRLVIPSLYYWKSAKWLNKIVFMENNIKGYWEERGYHITGDPWKEERYS